MQEETMIYAHQERADEVLARLSRVGAGLRAVERAAQSYPRDERPPYQPAATELHYLVIEAHAAYTALAQQGRELRARQEPPTGRIGSLYRGWQAGRQAGTLQASIQALEEVLARAGQKLAELQARPLAVAARSAELRRVGDEAGRAAAELRTAGLYGAELDQAAGKVQQLAADLDRLPAWLFESAADHVLEQATRPETVGAWQALAEIEAPLGQHAARLAQWQRQWREACHMQAELPGILARAAAARAALPAEIDAGDLEAELHDVQATAGQDPVGRVESSGQGLAIDQLAAAAARLSAVAGQAQALVARAQDIARQLADLQARLARAAGLADSIQKRMGQGAAVAVYPLAWETCRNRWQRLSEALSDLEGVQQRTPERLEEDVHDATMLEASLQALAAEVERALEQREAVLRLLRWPELGAAPPWLEQAQTLHEATSRYAAGNWPEALAVPQFYDDALALEARCGRLLAADVGRPLLPSALDDLAGQVATLIAEITRFQARLQGVEAALHALQQREQAARQQLAPACQALDELVRALQAADLPLAGRTARRRRAVERLAREGSNLAQDLDHPEAGLVADKVKHLDRWSSACRYAVERLLPALAAEKAQRQAELQARVEDLQALGRFDLEQPMRQAGQRLAAARPETVSGLGWRSDRQPADLATLSTEAGRFLDERAALLVAVDDLDAKIARPLQQAIQVRDTARREALRRQEQMCQRRETLRSAWPPLACDIAWAEDQLRQAQANEQRLPRHGRSVGAVHELLEAATGGYREASAELKQKERQIDEQYRELQTLAGQIERRQRQLAAYRQAHGDDPAVAEAIGVRLSRIDTALAPLRQQWQHDPPGYRQARGELQKVWSAAYGDIELPGSRNAIRRREIEKG
jgi:chromosome segregation ATPase